MKKQLTLKEVMSIGGKISNYNNGSTNSISLTKLLKKENIILKGEDIKLCYLVYSQIPQIQAVYKITDINDENCVLEELYNKLNEI